MEAETVYSEVDALKTLQEFDDVGTTSEVAEEVECVRRTAYNKLFSIEGTSAALGTTDYKFTRWSLLD
ncbi:hypothetical protein HYG81_19685 (plasmid) [Natrinema zhouii]|uniref:hypothetical protein n=1 Tax=Natrinema zhouii TaxID=1710539 RepID=UPI001CFF5722|nr:hypothetical protein [Natrinema zhouii]UHQ98295.1 hypothetical protein HYG81_19685 [Natrinema zhouii]